MKRYYKFISLTLVVIMVSVLLGACGTKQNPNSGSSSGAPLEITIINAAGGTPDINTGDPVLQSNPIAQDILKKFNIKINWVMLTGDGNQQMGMKLASGEYGDVITNLGTDAYTKMLNEKMIVPLNPLLDKEGADIKKAYGDSTLNFLKESDGNIYHLVNTYGNIPQGVNPPGYGFGFQLRKDIYDALGDPQIKTLDDVYNVLVKIKNDPTLSKNWKGQKVWPIGTFNRTWLNMIQGLEAMGGSGTSQWIVNNGQVQYWFRAPWAQTIITWYNKVYREGLLDPESFTVDPDTWQKEKVNQGLVASTIGSWYMVADAWGQFKAQNVPNADNMWYENFAVSVPGGDTPQLVSEVSTGAGNTVITNKCKNPDQVMKMLNWMATAEGNFEVLNGPEGSQWDMVNGKPQLKPDYLAKWTAGNADPTFTPTTGIDIYQHFVSTNVGRSPWGTYWILKDDPTLTNRPDFAQRDQALGSYWFDAAPFVGIDSGLPDDIAMKQSTIGGKLNNQVYTPVLAKSEAACISDWQKFLADMDASGAKDVEAAVTAKYQANLKKLGK